MIIEGKVNAIERSGGVNENKFTIEANGKAFRVLSDSLYPDKPKAILRELSCNAYDAHVAAGCPEKPFTVHLPTALEPWLTIRDYGIGLTPEEMCGYWKTVVNEDGKEERVFVGGIYNTFFKSTKTTSNDYIGALGLGSKSPFSYVDSFTVISRKDGVQYSFTAYINENDEPEIVELGREATNEGNGLEVTMPVKKNDYHIFAEKAKLVLQWFDPQPVVTGAHNWRVATLNPKVVGSNWVLNTDSPYGSYGAVAVQGKVAYPIDAYALDLDNNTDVDNLYWNLLRSHLVIRFPIGELDVTASRETLSYKGPTIQNIKNALKIVADELPLKFKDVVDACQTEWEARTKFSEIINQVPVLGQVITKERPFMWKNKQFQPYDHMKLLMSSYPSIEITMSSSYRANRRKVFGLENKVDVYTIAPSASSAVFIDDLKRGGASRVRQFIKRSNEYSTGYTIKGTDAEVKKVIDALGSPKTILTSTLDPLPSRSSGSTSSGGKRSIYQEFDRPYCDSSDIDPQDMDIDAGGVYLPILRNYPCDGDLKDKNFAEVFNAAFKAGVYEEGDVVIGVLRSKTKSFDESDKWVNFYEDVKSRLKDKLSTVDMAGVLARRNAYSHWRNSSESYHSSWAAIALTELPEGHPIRVFRERIEEAQKAQTDEHSELYALAKLLDFKFDTQNAVELNFKADWHKLVERYPMFRFLDSYSYPEAERKTILEYIKSVDEKALQQDATSL